MDEVLELNEMLHNMLTDCKRTHLTGKVSKEDGKFVIEVKQCNKPIRRSVARDYQETENYINGLSGGCRIKDTRSTKKCDKVID